MMLPTISECQFSRNRYHWIESLISLRLYAMPATKRREYSAIFRRGLKVQIEMKFFSECPPFKWNSIDRELKMMILLTATMTTWFSTHFQSIQTPSTGIDFQLELRKVRRSRIQTNIIFTLLSFTEWPNCIFIMRPSPSWISLTSGKSLTSADGKRRKCSRLCEWIGSKVLNGR